MNFYSFKKYYQETIHVQIIFNNWLIGLEGWVFANGPGDQVSILGSHTKDLKMVS